MKNTLALSVLKVEGIGEQSGCYISVDGKLLDAVSILNMLINENYTEVPIRGELTIHVKSLGKNENLQCSVSIDIEALPDAGTVWLPLYSGSTCETLPRIPSTLPCTKILISVNQLSQLTPVPEITEYDSSFFDIENSLYKTFTGKNSADHEKCKKTMQVINEKNKELRGKILEIDGNYEKCKEEHLREKNLIAMTNHECFSKLAIQLEKNKLQCMNLQVIHDDQVLQVNALQMLFKQETLQREYIEKQLLRITKEFQDYAKTSEEKSMFYEAALKNKDLEIDLLQKSSSISSTFIETASEKDEHVHNLSVQLHNAIEKLQESEFQRKVLQQKLEAVSEFHSKELEELLKIPFIPVDNALQESNFQLQKYKKKCVELENLLDERYVEIKSKDPDESLQKSSEAHEEIKNLKELLAQEKKNSTILLQQLREKACKELENKVKGADEKFVEYLKNYEIEDQFEKISEGLFSYANKRISVAIKNGCLICKVNGGYMGIERFLKNFGQSKDPFHKRSQTAAILKEKSPSPEVRTKVAENRFNFTKLNTKENTEDIAKHPRTVSSRMSKEQSFTPSKNLIYRRVCK